MPEHVGPIAEEFIESEYWEFDGDEEEYLEQLNKIDDPLDEYGDSELFFNHEETGRRMYLLFQNQGHAEASLIQGFRSDLSQQYEEDRLLGQLSDALFESYKEIEMEEGSPHTKDPRMRYPVRAHIPYNAARSEVEGTVEAVSEMTKEVEKKDEKVRQKLSELIDELS